MKLSRSIGYTTPPLIMTMLLLLMILKVGDLGTITCILAYTQLLLQRSICCRSRKCIRDHIPMHAIFFYFFIPVLAKSCFTSRTLCLESLQTKTRRQSNSFSFKSSNLDDSTTIWIALELLYNMSLEPSFSIEQFWSYTLLKLVQKLHLHFNACILQRTYITMYGNKY